MEQKLESKTESKQKVKEKTVEITLQPINVKKLIVPIVGRSPLLMDRFPDETKKAILAKQAGVSKSSKKLVRKTDDEIKSAIHTTSKGKIGFPSYGFKKGILESTAFVGDKFFSKKLVSGLRIVNTDEGLIEIKFDKQTVLQHDVKGQTKFNPLFHGWSCELVIEYDANNINPSDITTLINYAGFYYGLGSWRPKGRDGGSGEYGMYEVKSK